MEGGDGLGAGHGVGNAGAGIPGDQVDLDGEAGAAEEASEFAGVFGTVGDAAEEDVLEGEALAGT